MIRNGSILRCAIPALLAAVAPTFPGATGADYHSRRAWTLKNEKVTLIVAPGGGHIASLTLNSGPGSGINPYWLPPWPTVEPGEWRKHGDLYGGKPAAQLLSSILGHSLCLDFFGTPSEAESKAGIPVHGEASCINWQATTVSTSRMTYSADLPISQLKVTRTITLTPGSSALWITEKVENRGLMDRPIGWQQHVTLGPPFLQEGATRFDMSAGWGTVDKREFSKAQRLKSGVDFTWPNAPGAKGGTVNLREYPTNVKNSDFSVCEMDPAREWVYFTAVNPQKRLMIGYIWRRAEWPWAANWEENQTRTGPPWNGRAIARGIEFGTTPFAYSRHDTVNLARLHGTPTYRWIAAQESQTISYAAFISPIPSSVVGVKDVQLKDRRIEIVLDGSDDAITLPIGP